MNSLYPFRMQPIFRSYIWGGRKLATTLRKQLPDRNDYAESWEIVDHGDDQSVVMGGNLQGWTLSRLVREHGKELFGIHHPQSRFPLLFKFLDCQRNLSVQVHPNDAQGAKLDPPDLGKTEAWVIIEAAPGACLYAGLKAGLDRDTFAQEIRRGTAEQCLHRIEPSVGDCVFIPAGTVHALGSGLVVAEIQQSSNTTFRLYDWNRVGTDGQARPLHIDQGLAVIDFDRGPIRPQQPEPVRPGIEQLVQCDKFILNRITVSGQRTLSTDGVFHILSVLSGDVVVDGDVSNEPLQKGETILLPASMSEIRLTPVRGTATLLDMMLPPRSPN